MNGVSLKVESMAGTPGKPDGEASQSFPPLPGELIGWKSSGRRCKDPGGKPCGQDKMAGRDRKQRTLRGPIQGTLLAD